MVVSEEQGEVEKFGKWELDITPHRLIKEGIALPEAMRKQPQFQKDQIRGRPFLIEFPATLRHSEDPTTSRSPHPYTVGSPRRPWRCGGGGVEGRSEPASDFS